MATKKAGPGRTRRPRRVLAGTVGSSVATGPAQEWVGRFAGEQAIRSDLSSDLELARVVEEGLPARAVDAAVKSGILEQEVVYRFVVAKRTLQRRRDDDVQRLSRDESEKLTRLVRGIARAELALGDAARAEKWIRQPNRALQGKRPLDLLSSEAGARAVEKVLGRIEHGIFS